MRILPHVRSLWNTLVHKDRLDRELDDELRAAIETLADRYVADGMNPQAARRAAIRTVADPSVVGRRITVNDDFATLVGVLPKGFRLLLPHRATTSSPMDALRTE